MAEMLIFAQKALLNFKHFQNLIHHDLLGSQKGKIKPNKMICNSKGLPKEMCLDHNLQLFQVSKSFRSAVSVSEKL